VRALIPGDHPKIQVKLALPEDFDDFTLHPLCMRPKNKESQDEEDDDILYRMGNQKFGVATIVPPVSNSKPFTLMSYLSREDKSLKLPFSLACKYDKRASQGSGGYDIYDYQCTFRMNQLQDMTTDEFYFPLITNVSV
jgi:hypothetical protein